MSTSAHTPKYHWTFAEVSSSGTRDTVSGITATVSKASWNGRGRIGKAVALNGSVDSFISLGQAVGQFGRADFTVAFGVKIAIGSKGVELLGNRTTDSYGNFFTIRVNSEQYICTEICENSSATHYIGLDSSSKLSDGTWHHIAVVREQQELRLYIDGTLSAQRSVGGVANISNGNELRTGKANPGFLAPPKAEFEDLRIYDRALSDQQISALVPPLRKGEFELKTAADDDVTRIWTTDVADLSQITSSFEKLRLGPDTGVTLYKDSHFSGTFQEVAADLPKLSQTRLAGSPKSVRIWSTVGKPFTGKWAILAPNGQYLSLAYPSLATNSRITAFELFDFHVNAERLWIQLLPGSSFSSSHSASGIQIDEAVPQIPVFVEREKTDFHRFSLTNQQGDFWLRLKPRSNLILLKARNGQYLRARNNEVESRKGAIWANASNPGVDSIFELIKLQDNTVALKSFQRELYLRYLSEDPNFVLADSSAKYNYELIELDNNRVAFKTQDEKYFSAEGGGGREVVANRSALRAWEKFELTQARIEQFNDLTQAQVEHFNRLAQTQIGHFEWTSERENRAIFNRILKIAGSENQVGELLPGEAAFYEQPAYWGKTWILYNSCSDFGVIEGFNDVISSIRLGPETGITLYSGSDYGVTSQDREKEIEDIVENIPDLSTSQIGNDQISSAKIWRNIPPKKANVSFSISLSQDYKLVGETFQDLTSYRTILKFLPEVTEVEVWATDLTKFEVDGTDYEVDEDRSIKLSPNAMNRLMITSEAEGINTPGLKIRTNTMQAHERIVIFPDREAHRQLADLDEDALWDAKDAAGDQLVNQTKYTAAEVANVQRTVAKTMRTLSYVAVDEDDQLIDRVISADAIEKPWRLNFRQETNREPGEGENRSLNVNINASSQITEQELEEEDFAQLLTQASGPLAQGFSFKNVFRRIKDAVNSAVSVVVGVVQNVATGIVNAVNKVVDTVKQVVAVVVDAAGEVTRFVIDTAEKAAAFVEGVVGKIEVAAKKLAEYLRSLFNWDDILATQRMLALKVNDGFDFAQKAAIAAIAPVNELVDTVKNAVNSGLDETLNRLKKDTEKIDQQPKLPETLEWLLSKLTSNSSSFSDTTKAVSPSPSGTDPVAAFFSTFQSSSKAVVDMLLKGLAGLTETIALLIAAPTQPQFALIALLEMIKGVVNTAFDFIKGIAEAFLKCIASAIGQFKSLINAEINIPFVTALFKKVLKIDKFNLLNLTTLLLAIPVTITYKLLAGSEAKLALSQTASVQGWMVTGFIADTINGLVTSLLDASPKEHLGFEVVSTLLQFFSWLSSFPDSPDFDGGRPYNVAEFKVTEPKNPDKYWERVMWGWRSFALGIDVVALLVAKTRIKRAIHKKDPTKVEDAVEKTMPVLAMLFAAIDLGITTKYLVTSLNDNAKEGDSRASKTHKESIRQSGEYIAIFPSFFAFLNYGGPQSKLTLGLIDIVCAGVVSGLKGDEMRREFKSA
ncbi:hypothetical protein H6G89_24830 [Oscillatoria sp. FACHB-1407]|uniref:LamG-like jellyroll fold domain-containing protein n=1 Tax=Oscillatoria sp. FACHB-1407 TaxID=2692847 RepID=UPI00168218E3|nr:LamG-like jellyroll fold domain-containing protein [Oscillatoria sp. FACHB-1407]MBD2464233.1 hypothetical protein [Oscillatoria sp. FACHB-1407]